MELDGRFSYNPEITTHICLERFLSNGLVKKALANDMLKEKVCLSFAVGSLYWRDFTAPGKGANANFSTWARSFFRWPMTDRNLYLG